MTLPESGRLDAVELIYHGVIPLARAFTSGPRDLAWSVAALDHVHRHVPAGGSFATVSQHGPEQ